MERHKRFMVFGFADYYPSGGLNDVVGSFDTEDEYMAAVDKEQSGQHGNPNTIFYHENLYVFDRVLGVIVWDKDDKRPAND